MNKQTRIIKLAQVTIGNDPKEVAKNLATIIYFMFRKMDYAKRPTNIMKLRSKIYNLDEYDIASKKSPSTAALGQSITFIKTMLNGQDPGYIRNVLNELSKVL